MSISNNDFGDGNGARKRATAVFEKMSEAWARGDFAAVRSFSEQVRSETVPPQFKSYALLRAAQSYSAEGSEANAAAAKRLYEEIRDGSAYPEAHRFNAAECIAEIDRLARGLPARDPAASRTAIPDVHARREFFVATDGDDGNPGSEKAPFATLERARDHIRALRKNGDIFGAVAVTVKPGEYPVTQTFSLVGQDSGTKESPVVYRAEKPGGTVFYGGKRISGFEIVDDGEILARLPEESRGMVYRCDLKAQGITDFPDLEVRGVGQPPSPPTLEVFFDGEPMTLARWPNKGFVDTKSLVEPGEKGKTPSIIEYESDRHARWTKAEDAWLFGYFKRLWADSTIRVGSIDTEAKTLTTADGYDYNGGMDTTQGIIYYAFNLLEEIDSPGEWYLDRSTGILYFWPPSDPNEACVEIGTLSQPMIAIENASCIRIEGLVFDLGRYNCMTVTDSQDCLVAGCNVKRFAGNGITITGGMACGIYGCHIHSLGCRGTEVIGGDRTTLIPGEHFVENCEIHDFGRIDRTYTPAIQLEGVGNRVAHNLMYDCPSSVMRIEGNDHLIEYNETHDAVTESDDQGAMELWYNPSYRGVIFRYNLFYDNGKTGAEAQVHGQAAIRLDDAICGVSIYGNVFIRSSNGNFGAIQINSGRDNVFDNNIFVECKHGISGAWNPGNTVWKTIREGNPRSYIIMNDFYLKRYPEMAHMMEEPGINNIWRNVFYRCGDVITRDEILFDMLANGVFDNDPGFKNADANDFRLHPDAELFNSVGFRLIPIEEIGLYDGGSIKP